MQFLFYGKQIRSFDSTHSCFLCLQSNVSFQNFSHYDLLPITTPRSERSERTIRDSRPNKPFRTHSFTKHTFTEFKDKQRTQLHHAASNSFFHTSCEKTICDIHSVPKCVSFRTKHYKQRTPFRCATKEQEHARHSPTATTDPKTTTPTAFARTNLLALLVGSYSHGRIWFHGQLHYDHSRKRH